MQTDTKHHNPCAFPVSVPDTERLEGEINYGMTLRDYFAGQALAGMMADPGVLCGNEHEQRLCARMSYGLADAMLAERAKE